jgi:hypothetical protein
MIFNANYTIDRIHTNYTDLDLTELHFKILEAALHCGSRGIKQSDLCKKFTAFRKLTVTEREEIIQFLRNHKFLRMKKFKRFTSYELNQLLSPLAYIRKTEAQ